jgi:hypothetical protein
MPVHDWARVDAGIFHHFHSQWISATSRALNAGLLPPEYYALDEQVAGGLGPDVLTLGRLTSSPTQPRGNGSPGTDASGHGVALATRPPRVRFTMSAERKHYARKRKRIAIRHSSGHQVVAIIEIISPGNKASRDALNAFRGKVVELLDAGVHLLIADLFPPGPRDPQGIHGAIWSKFTKEDFQLPPDKPLTMAAYAAGKVTTAYVEPIAVGDMLPEMPLFLTPDFYVPVPLEGTYRTAWDGVPQFWREALEAPKS